MSEFDFNIEQKESKWLVDKLIPLGQLCIILAQAGVGKSLLINSLAISIIHDMPYADLDVVGGNVLIIDQDTPTDVLNRRLKKWNDGMSTKAKYKLFVESMNEYSLDNGTLMAIVKDYAPMCSLIIIDCLHTVLGKLNPNYIADMNYLSTMKKKCLNGNCTILVNHHISQKERIKLEDLMQGDTAHLAMGSSAIIQQADSYYILGASAIEGRAERLFIRPVSKRVSIPTNPIILRLLQVDGGEKLYYDGYYEIGLEQVENHVLMLFREQNIERGVKEIYEAMNHRHGEKALRTALDSLEEKGYLMMSKGRSNLFKYRLARTFETQDENNNGKEI